MLAAFIMHICIIFIFQKMFQRGLWEKKCLIIVREKEYNKKISLIIIVYCKSLSDSIDVKKDFIRQEIDVRIQCFHVNYLKTFIWVPGIYIRQWITPYINIIIIICFGVERKKNERQFPILWKSFIGQFSFEKQNKI